jgi:hypothetical protein
MTGGAPAALLAASILCLWVLGCGTFDTREAAEPTGSSTDFIDPFDPETVILDILNTVNQRNADYYNSLIAPGFTFVPDPSDENDLEAFYPGVFDGWDAGVEEDVAEKLLDPSRTTFTLLTFTEESIIEETDSTQVVQQDYSLIIKIENIETYKGTARFYMRRLSDGLWYLYRWEDNRTEAEGEDFETWGYLKGLIRATT